MQKSFTSAQLNASNVPLDVKHVPTPLIASLAIQDSTLTVQEVVYLVPLESVHAQLRSFKIVIQDIFYSEGYVPNVWTIVPVVRIL